MAEIEAQTIGGDQRTLLGDMAAKPVPERRMQQVGGAVVCTDLRPSLGIDRQVDDVAKPDADRLDGCTMGVNAAKRLGGHGPDRPEPALAGGNRQEERRVGKRGVWKCSFQGWKKK